MALSNNFSGIKLEAGCDEAGRGCLAGPVFAGAVILPEDFYHPVLDDSKKLNESQRYMLREVIIKECISWAVHLLSPTEIDKYNILWASVRAMHGALDDLVERPEYILVDGNKFIPYRDVTHQCIIKGDGIYTSIAAASILAKTFRDDHMLELHQKFSHYHWGKNKGYPTFQHRNAIIEHGPCEHHRKSFQLYPNEEQLSIFSD